MFSVQRIRTYKSKLFIAPAPAFPADSVAVAKAESKIFEQSRVCWCQRAAIVY